MFPYRVGQKVAIWTQGPGSNTVNGTIVCLKTPWAYRQPLRTKYDFFVSVARDDNMRGGGWNQSWAVAVEDIITEGFIQLEEKDSKPSEWCFFIKE